VGSFILVREVRVVESGASSVPRRQLGRYLKAALEEAGIGLLEACRLLEISKAKMYRLERGERVAALRRIEIRALCELYRVPDDLTEAYLALAAEANSPGWWHAYGDVVPGWFELYVGMEQAATRLRHYEPALVPGLLQTAPYAAAVFGTRPGAKPEDVERAVEVRMARQRLLQRDPPPPQVDVILSEAVLRQPIGNRQDMADQLLRLLEVANAGVSVRILPLAVGPHAASVAGAFVLLDIPGEPETVYSEGLTGALYLEKDVEVAKYEVVWGELARLALDSSASAGLLQDLAREYKHAEAVAEE
jgi:transcriptional regulator with XRE-family HTH domain